MGDDHIILISPQIRLHGLTNSSNESLRITTYACTCVRRAHTHTLLLHLLSQFAIPHTAQLDSATPATDLSQGSSQD